MCFQKKRRNSPEQQIQKAVVEHLLVRGHPDAFYFHCPNGGYRRPIEAAILKEIGTVAGVPDLIIVHTGRVFALELKAPGGRVSDVQAVVHERLRRAGAEVAVAWGLDQALKQLFSWNLLRGRA
jgi:hypothetical protein